MTGEQLVVTNVEKKYGQRRAIDGVSVSFPSGVTALLGVNGAGKSTLIRALATVEKLGAGEIRWEGGSVAGGGGRRAYRRQLGWLPQQPSMPLSSTVRTYVDYVAWLKEVPRARRRAAVEAAAEAVGMRDRLDDRIGTLSGGMQRRVGLSQALVNCPSVLLLDEPTSGLDPRQRIEFAALVKARANSAAIVLATHLLEDVMLTASNLMVLDAGRLLFFGTLAEFAECGPDDVTVEGLGRRFAQLGPSGHL